jgi:hypothetical protein
VEAGHVNKKPKIPIRRHLAARTKSQHDDLQDTTGTQFRKSTITTSLTAAATPVLTRVLRNIVDRASKITVLANLVGTAAVLRLLRPPGHTLPMCVFNQTFFNWCNQVCSTSRGKHDLLKAKLADTAEQMRVKEAINHTYLHLSSLGGLDCLQPHNLPSKDGLTIVLNYESRKRVVNLTMMYSFERLQAKRFKALKSFLYQLSAYEDAPKWPAKLKVGRVGGILARVMDSIQDLRKSDTTLTFLQEFTLFTDAFAGLDITSEAQLWWFEKLLPHLNAHLQHLAYPLYMADRQGFSHLFVRYDTFLSSITTKDSSVLPQIPIGPRFVSICHLTLDWFEKSGQINQVDRIFKPPRGRRKMAGQANTTFSTNGVELKRMYTKPLPLYMYSNNANLAELTPRNVPLGQWQSLDWISVDPGKVQIVTAVRHFPERDLAHHRTTRMRKGQRLKEAGQSEYILNKKEWADMCGFTKTKSKLKYFLSQNREYKEAMEDLGQHQRRTHHLDQYESFCQCLLGRWYTVWAEHTRPYRRQLRFERFQRQQRALQQVTRDLLGSRFPRPDEQMAGYPGVGVIWGNAGFAPGTKGHASAPNKKLVRQLRRVCLVVMGDEFRTTKLSACCNTETRAAYGYKWRVSPEVGRELCRTKLRGVFYCGQCNRPWNRDVSASICIGDVAKATCLLGLPPTPFRRARKT